MKDHAIFRSLYENEVFFEQVTDAITFVDREGYIVYINKKAAEIIGYTRGEKAVKLAEVYADSHLMQIMDQQRMEHEVTIHINGYDCIATRFPLYREGRVIGAAAIFNDISHYNALNEKILEGNSEINILNTILEIAYDGIVVVDAEGYITMMSNAYKKFLGLEDRDVIGKHVTDVIENTRMHLVAKSKIPEINDLQEINGNYMVATRIPYYNESRFAGVIGKVIFRNVSELNEIYEKIHKMEQEIKSYKMEFEHMYNAKYNFESIIGRSKKIRTLKHTVERVAASRSNVLIMGESGTGKELFAHALHNSSRRSLRPFVSVNCAAIPEALLEAELFGYEKGAFTGADQNGRIGKFEIADGGSIFLDEIGDMPLAMQAKILRVIQEGEVERIGSNKPKQIDVRIIAATNRPLKEMVADKTFREDLYYRLNVFNLNIPPLRERKADINDISAHFIEKLNREMGRKIDGFSKKAEHLIMRYDWPGNVRELINVIERAYTIIESETSIQTYHLPSNLKGEQKKFAGENLKELMEDYEKRIIIDRLAALEGNKSKVAEDLGVSRMTLYNKLERYGLEEL